VIHGLLTLAVGLSGSGRSTLFGITAPPTLFCLVRETYASVPHCTFHPQFVPARGGSQGVCDRNRGFYGGGAEKQDEALARGEGGHTEGTRGENGRRVTKTCSAG